MNRRRGVRRIGVDETMDTVEAADPLVAAALAGDETAFARLIEPYRRELHVHCYRMLGSVEDAEDAVQETQLRAWSRLSSYAGRASFRAWLYGIATHACLDALRRRKARTWPTELVAAADPRDYRLAAEADIPWLQPYPDRLLDAVSPDAGPEALAIAREGIELAFLVAIQRLPARQRAVLVLRDVLEWPAKQTAAALDMTPAAVNSALQRAHAALAANAERLDGARAPNASEQTLVQRLIRAWERMDTDELIGLLGSDAQLVMPPALAWFSGRAAIEVFFRRHVFEEMRTSWRLVPTSANRQPALGVYWREPGEAHHTAFAICVLGMRDGVITEMDIFRQPELFAAFALPETL